MEKAVNKIIILKFKLNTENAYQTDFRRKDKGKSVKSALSEFH